MSTFEAMVRLPNGGQEKVHIQASSWNHAKQLLEMQYGTGRVYNITQK